MAISDRLLAAAKNLGRLKNKSPVDHIPWLPTQLQFLQHNNSRMPYLFRAGNRQGKTTVGAAEVIFRARGYHPYKDVPKRPVKIAVVCMALNQSIPIQEMVWDLIDKSLLVEGVTFNKKTGFGAHTPLIELNNGSTIRFYGCAQGAGALAGAEFDFILLDEPPSQDVYDECIKRVANTGGSVALTLTPINGPPLPWLKALCESEVVKDYHMLLTPESQISPITGRTRLTKDGTPWDADFIEHIVKLTSPIDAPIRIHGEWQSVVTGQFFNNFNKNKHIVDFIPEDEYKIALGLDYASADRDNGLCCILTFWTKKINGDDNIVFAVDEVSIHGSSSMKSFAEEILRMLKRHNISWHEIDYVWGDNPATSGASVSSNTLLMKEIKKLINKKMLKPEIRSAKTGGGSSGKHRHAKDIRCRWLHQKIGTDQFYIQKNCVWLIESIQVWDYDDSSKNKDILDSLMYGLKTLWQEGHTWTPVQLNIV